MLIDWFTVGAQILNFLILVWLLKRFLYKPILAAIDEREQRIASTLTDASEKEADALKQRDAYQKKNAAFDQQRAALMRQATAEANTERQRLLDAARLAAEALRTKQQATWRSEEQRLHDEIIRRTREEVIAITRKVLADLADMTLEQRMIEVFVRRLQELDGAAKDRLVDALRTDSGPVRVRSVFDLSAAQQATLQQAIEALLSSTVTLRFETGPDLLSGIALSINGQKIVWSVTDYLQQLEQSLATFVTSQSAPDDAVATHVVALPKTGQPA